MPEPTAEAWAQIRHDYENTDKPIAAICAEHGISSGTLRDRMRRWQWRRRRPPIPREGPPPVVVQDVYSPPPVRAANGGEGSGVGGLGALQSVEAPPTPLRLADASRSDPPRRVAGGGMEFAAPHLPTSPPPEDGQEVHAETGKDPAAIVPRLQSAVARVLPAIEATIARLASGPQHPRDMEQAGRALSSLTRTLRELNGLLAEHNARPAGTCNCGYDMPEDLDAFRLDLARRIRAFVESRTRANGEDLNGEADGAPA